MSSGSGSGSWSQVSSSQATPRLLSVVVVVVVGGLKPPLLTRRAHSGLLLLAWAIHVHTMFSYFTLLTCRRR